MSKSEEWLGALVANHELRKSQNVAPGAINTYRMIGLLYFRATNAHPSTARRHARPTERPSVQTIDCQLIEAPFDDPDHWEHAESPPLHQLIKCVAESIARGSAWRDSAAGRRLLVEGTNTTNRPDEALTANLYKTVIDQLEEETAR